MNNKYQNFYKNFSKNELKQTGVYKISHRKKPNLFYIGSASISNKKYPSENGFYKRWRDHIIMLKSNTHNSTYLQNVVNKYGIEDILFEILEIVSPQDCIKREEYWINKLKVFDPKFGYNTTKISTSRKGLKNRSESIIKCKNTWRNKLKIYYKEIVELYESGKSSTEIGKLLKLHPITIIKILKLNNIELRFGINKTKSILQFDKNDNFIKEWRTAKEAASTLNLSSFANIYQVCNGVRNSAFNFKWKYK